MRLRYGPRALADLERLHRFVARKDPAAADRIRRRLLVGIDALIEQPGLGRALDEGRPLRQWTAGEHVVHYVVRGDEEVIVPRIWHGREARRGEHRAAGGAGASSDRLASRAELASPFPWPL